jgi:SAM-dependent methyltransferase
MVPVVEQLIPPLGRRLRKWDWLWQPTYGRKWSERFYSDAVDPYAFGSSPYEIGKYQHTIRLLSAARPYERALEIGAAESVFTEMLAPLCRSLTAIEMAEAAVVRARDRMERHTHVTVIHGALPNEMPDDMFDLIVASDILYYFPSDVLVQLIKEFERRLNPDGTLFCLHYLGDFGQTVHGSETHELLKRHTSLKQVHDETVSGVGPGGKGYIVTMFRK